MRHALRVFKDGYSFIGYTNPKYYWWPFRLGMLIGHMRRKEWWIVHGQWMLKRKCNDCGVVR